MVAVSSASSAPIWHLSVSASPIRPFRACLLHTLSSIAAHPLASSGQATASSRVSGYGQLQSPSYAPGFRRLVRLMRGAQFVCVQIVQHHPDCPDIGVRFIAQPPHLLGEVRHCPLLCDLNGSPTILRFAQHKQIACAVAPVLVVVTLRSYGLRADRWSRFTDKPLGGLVAAQHRSLRIVLLLILVQ